MGFRWGLVVGIFFASLCRASDDPFLVTLHCRDLCQSEIESSSHPIELVFSPAARGLKKGNGEMWGVLGWNLWTWGREACLDAAIERCVRKPAIPEVTLEKMTTGSWSLREPVDCRERTEHLVSPYDPGRTLARPASSAVTPFPERSSTLTAPVATASCRRPTDVRLCYGDCLVPSRGDEFAVGDPGLQTLASTKFMTKQTTSFCLDGFLKKYAGQGLSPSVLQHYCESYLWKGIAEKFPAFQGCAATRITTECAALSY